MEDRQYGGNTVDPFEAQRQGDQHPGQRIKGGEDGLLAELLSNLRADNLDVTDAKVGNEEMVLERGDDGRIGHALEFIEGTKHAALRLVAIVNNGLLYVVVARASIRSEMERVLLQKIIRDGQGTGVVEILLARDGLAFKCLNNLGFALVESLFAGLLNIERDQHFVVGGGPVSLDAGIFQAGALDLRMDGARIRRVCILHLDQRSATEVHTQRDAMPERHGKHSGNAEDQREGQEVPLFPEEIDVCISEKFHAAYDPFKISRWSLVAGCSGYVARFSLANDDRPTKNDCPRYLTLRRAVCGSKPNQKSHATQTLP